MKKSKDDFKAIVQQVVTKYDNNKGSWKKIKGFFSSPFSRSTIMQAISQCKDEKGLENLILEYYKSLHYIFTVNSLSMECVFKLDNEIFRGSLIEKLIKQKNSGVQVDDEHSIVTIMAMQNIYQYFCDNSEFKRIIDGRKVSSKECLEELPIFWAIANGSSESAIALIKDMCKMTEYDRYAGEKQKTPLHFIVAKGRSYRRCFRNRISERYFGIYAKTMGDVFNACMERKDVKDFINLTCKDGNTPLHIACMRRDKMMIKALIHKGASLNIENNNNETPLQLYKKECSALDIATKYLRSGLDLMDTSFDPVDEGIIESLTPDNTLNFSKT
tara:strand:- start:398 stop:1387 length:990 start_codon:yes stop_codon:yes gene_type:complete